MERFEQRVLIQIPLIEVIQVVKQIPDVVLVEMVVCQRGAQELGVRNLTSLVDVNFFNEALYVILIDVGFDRPISIDRPYFSEALIYAYSARVVHID